MVGVNRVVNRVASDSPPQRTTPTQSQVPQCSAPAVGLVPPSVAVEPANMESLT
jgi:hypothetical protein